MASEHKDIQYVLQHFYRVPVETVMRKDIWNMPVAYPDTHIEHIFSIMTARRHVWVLEKKGSTKLVGIITEKDLMEVMIPHRISTYMVGSFNARSLLFGNIKTAGDIMVKKLVVAHPNDTLEDVMEKMRSFRVRRLPVVDKKGNLVGDITIKILIIQFRKILKWYRIMKDQD